MTDIPEKKPAIPAVVGPDATVSSWESARSRQAATREAVTRYVDNRVANTVTGIVPAEAPGSAFAPSAGGTDDPIATMKRRGLLLADALQRHALLKIAETGIILDEIDRAVAITMRSDSEGD